MCAVSNALGIEIRKSWGERLRSVRVDRNLTQDQVAVLAGLDHSTVSRVEAGTAGFKGFLTVAQALNVNLVEASA